MSMSFPRNDALLRTAQNIRTHFCTSFFKIQRSVPHILYLSQEAVLFSTSFGPFFAILVIITCIYCILHTNLCTTQNQRTPLLLLKKYIDHRDFPTIHGNFASIAFTHIIKLTKFALIHMNIRVYH